MTDKECTTNHPFRLKKGGLQVMSTGLYREPEGMEKKEEKEKCNSRMRAYGCTEKKLRCTEKRKKKLRREKAMRKECRCVD
jgi:hypothetical protein